MEASALLRPQKIELLNQLPEAQRTFFKWFLALTEVHRPSGDLAKARETVIGWAKALGASFTEDKVGNMLFSIPATKGKESVPSLVIQGHIDIVAVGKFEEGGQVPVKIQDGKLTSGVSTLGADDGIAVAAMFALLETEKEYEHGPLEFLVTVDEEIGLVGAAQMDGPPFLKSRAMLNLDSEDWGQFFTSCAGGMNVWYEYACKRAHAEGKRLRLELSGFMSGHTGLVIQAGRANAVKWMARLLQASAGLWNLITIEGGDKHNAIPEKCFAEVVVSDEAKFKEIVTRVHEEAKKEMKAIELKNPTLVIKDAAAGPEALVPEDGKKIINLISSIYHGVFMNHPEIPGLVNTSQSLSVARWEGDTFKIQVFARSNEATQMPWLQQYNKSLGELAGVKVDIPESEIVMPWPAALGSRIMDVAKGVYKDLFGSEPQITGIHAGLECGAIQNRGYSDLEAISYGPDVHNAHTVEEYTTIDTAAKCYQLTLEIVKKWAQ